MNIYFGSTHLQTLCDLKTLAEKHNCYIHFGVDQENSVDVDFNEFDGATKRIIEELKDKGEFLNQNYCKTSMFLNFLMLIIAHIISLLIAMANNPFIIKDITAKIYLLKQKHSWKITWSNGKQWVATNF